jgi:hypothetical protein
MCIILLEEVVGCFLLRMVRGLTCSKECAYACVYKYIFTLHLDPPGLTTCELGFAFYYLYTAIDPQDALFLRKYTPLSYFLL